MRRNILSAAAPACLLIGLTPVAALADDAPVANATATAARVSDQVSISKTDTAADQTKSDAQAAVISIGGKPALGTGGTESGEGENRGALIDTVDKAPVRVQVAPWHVRADGTKDSPKRTSQAEAALARVEVPDQAKVGVLTSDASSEHTSTKSTGKSTSNALEVSLGESLNLVLLHSEVDSATHGNSYLVSLNGTKIGTQEQLAQLCALDLSVAQLSCLTASGGTADGITTGGAEVLGVQTALSPLNPASAFATPGTSGTGTPAILESVAQALPAPPAAETPRAAAVAPAPAELPRTGSDPSALAASGLAALGLGSLLRRRRNKKA
jgi:LPXTG-motif cell wall-anchored protein